MQTANPTVARQHDAITNKGTAFTREERWRYGLEGLLPTRVESLEEQATRVLSNLRGKANPLEKYRYLAALQNDNETLFFRVLIDHLEEMLPLVYTPTVGQACLEWSHIYAQPRGLYISGQQRGRIAQVLRNWPRPEVGIIVVTDGGRILGLGDLGANGMGIPIGKLALYTACAGVRPEICLPVMLDLGTDNEALRNDPLYLGEREKRMTGEPWDTLLEEFLAATQATFPGVIVQFEDFNTACAFRLLQRYRDRLCCFNDDVQGTGAMGLGGLYAAGRITGRKLSEQRILFVGAGEACLGIGTIVVPAMQREGLSEAQAKQQCLFVDSKGLIIARRRDLSEHKRPFAQDRAPAADLCAAIENFRPSALIGASAQGGLFTQSVLETMARVNKRPIIFALSNPTSNSECTAEHAYMWTEGRAVFASGSPFAPITVGARAHTPGQGNNSYVFPGIGLGL
ncbi:MAG TPA: NAD-dependent malic enzyme, partial [Burkholderiales bacterium]|nr:NAD-dependent malic enzyme [Burkholderiales bacterium]